MGWARLKERIEGGDGDDRFDVVGWIEWEFSARGRVDGGWEPSRRGEERGGGRAEGEEREKERLNLFRFDASATTVRK